MVTRRVEAPRLDAPHEAEGILPPREVALRRVAEEVRRLASSTLAFRPRPALHLLRGDGQGDGPPATGRPSYAHYRGMAVGEVAEATSRLALSRWPPGEALGH